jgi:GNAT superfamily N-acetyltransferase
MNPEGETIIRLATAADADRLVVMACKFLRESIYGELMPEAGEEQMAALVNNALEHGIVVVADAWGSTIVGMIAFFVTANLISGNLIAVEAAWWIDPAWRGGNEGRRLLDAAETWAKEAGATHLQMIAPFGSNAGVLYRRRDYREVESTFLKRLE